MDAITLRRFIPLLDYKDASAWWTAHKWPIPPLRFLPKIGLIALGPDGRKLAAGWLYKSDSALAWVEYLVADPTSDKIERGQALDLLIAGLAEEAKQLGYEALFTSSSHPALIQRYQAHGFVVGDTNTTQLVRRLK